MLKCSTLCRLPNTTKHVTENRQRGLLNALLVVLLFIHESIPLNPGLHTLIDDIRSCLLGGGSCAWDNI